MKYSVDVSTGSVETVLRNDAMPGACRPADGAMLVGVVSGGLRSQPTRQLDESMDESVEIDEVC